ncbi:MAG: RDD family protein [Halioglobus sp.]
MPHIDHHFPDAQCRLIAELVDCLVVGALTLVLLGAQTIVLQPLAALACMVMLSVIYQALCSKLFGATLGKWWAGIRVVSGNGTPLNWSSCLTRAILRTSAWLTLGLPILILRSARTLHDRASGTRLIFVAHAQDRRHA